VSITTAEAIVVRYVLAAIVAMAIKWSTITYSHITTVSIAESIIAGRKAIGINPPSIVRKYIHSSANIVVGAYLWHIVIIIVVIVP
jgi:hypothetical protein